MTDLDNRDNCAGEPRHVSTAEEERLRAELEARPEVVRCWECKSSGHKAPPEGIRSVWCDAYSTEKERDGFCDLGERRGGD